MTPTEIETLLKELELELLTGKAEELKKLGIDEITHLKGGKNYAAVLVDLERRKPIAILEKRNKEVIGNYLLSLGSRILNQIEEVSIDLWIAYKSVVEELIPKAQIVAEKMECNETNKSRVRSEKKKREKTDRKIKK